MIEKFKKGGTKKQGSILAQIQQLPKQLLELVLQAFSQWALQKGIDINLLLQDLNALEEALGMFMLELQGALALKARQGAKLNYIKTLKNQCAEDEEVVYYKRGGSVGCGCKKKEDGGEINKAQKGTVARFKNTREETKISGKGPDKTKYTRTINDYINSKTGRVEKSDTTYTKQNIGFHGQEASTVSSNDHEWRFVYDKMKKEYESKKKKGGEIKKDCGGTKIKKHQSGGLFGLFTNKGNLPTAPQVEDAYNGGTYSSETPGRLKRWFTGRKEVNRVTGPTNVQKVPRMIELVITTDGDTLYRERPAYNPEVVNGAWRGATSKYPDEEYNILKRRFNDARTVVSRFKNSFKNGGNLN